MLRLGILVLSFLINHAILGQCENRSIKINNNTREYQVGTLGQIMTYDSNDASALFKDGQKITDIGFARGLFLSARDINGNLKMAGARYNRPSILDYGPGPLSPEDGTPYFEGACTDNNNIWKFSATEIEELQRSFDSGTLTVDQLSDDIISYPAKGNSYYESTLSKSINFDLAPFYDYNDDGIYNPMDGDYPLAMEENEAFIPHQFTFTIFHDNKIHTFTHGDPLMVEIHQTTYLLNETNNPILNGSVFTRLKIINRNEINYTDFRIGIFNDTELGSYKDDFHGCDTLLNTQYVYNNGILDSRLDTIWPLTGIHYLNTPMSSYLDESGITYDPDVPKVNIYQPILNGYYLDYGQPTVGSNGFDPTNTELTSFMFHDTPDKDDGWSMYDIPGDSLLVTRTYTSFDPLGYLPDSIFPGPIYFLPNDRVILDFADFAVYDPDLDSLEIFNQLETISEELERAYNDHIRVFTFTSNNNSAKSNQATLEIFPNPSSGLINISLNNFNEGKLKIYNSLGELIKSITIKEHSLTKKIDMSSYPKGLYLVNFKNEINQVSTAKILLR